jgi:AMMECR1 domain-containing protein
MKRIESYTEIVIGKHGVLLEKEGQRAVFLPQVAPEQKWDRDTMLKHLSMKAGLPGDAYKQGCTFHVFEAQVFGE